MEIEQTNARREFLKRAGTVAWTVPAIQVVNMTGALAGEVNTSVVTTTTPPTTRPPECKDVYFRLKAEPKGDGWVWVEGYGRNDCIVGDWEQLIPRGIKIWVSGDEEEVVVKHALDNCKIVRAAHKGGSDKSPNQETHCFPAKIAEDGSYAVFTADGPGISHVELLIHCCVYENGR